MFFFFGGGGVLWVLHSDLEFLGSAGNVFRANVRGFGLEFKRMRVDMLDLTLNQSQIMNPKPCTPKALFYFFWAQFLIKERRRTTSNPKPKTPKPLRIL